VANFGPGDADFTVTATVTDIVNLRTPAIFSVSPRLEGDVLNLAFSATDLDADVIRAELTIIDETNHPIDRRSLGLSDAEEAIWLESQLTIQGLGALPTARFINMVLIDRSGFRSAETLVDFSRSEAGGLRLHAANFDGSKLTIKTEGLAENLEIEVNGRVVAPPRAVKIKGAGAKLVVKGDTVQLTLLKGPNRIRVRNSRGWSNILVYVL
jgi:hypothetical protein